MRSLAGEVGRHGVRVVGLRPNFTPETLPAIAARDIAVSNLTASLSFIGSAL